MSSLSLLALAAIPFFSQLVSAQSCSTLDNIKITFYGYPDGPGDTTAFGCTGSTYFKGDSTNVPKAGGSGTYEDPFTLATAAGSTNLKQCELVYIPYLKKYFRNGDVCTGCDSNHIDLWIGTDTTGGATQLSCETTLGTTTQGILVNPPSGLDVDSTNLWDGTCHTDQFFSGAAVSCSGGSSGGQQAAGGSSSSSAAAPPPASSSSAAAAPPAFTSAAAVVPPPVVQKQVVQPSPTNTATASDDGSVKNLFGAQKNEVQRPAPTTLQTVASSVVPPNEPTGIPLAANNGVCPTPGAAVCSTDGKQIGICNINNTVIFMDVAAGTKCKDGAMVFADA